MCARTAILTYNNDINNGQTATVIPFCKFTLFSVDTKLSSADRANIPLLAQLIPDGVKLGTILTVEFDPASQWLAVTTTITATYLQASGRVAYVTSTRSPEAVKESLAALGVDVPATIKEGRLNIDDWYTATLTGGRIDTELEKASLFEPIEGGGRVRSLKVADLSVEWLKQTKYGPQPSDIIEGWPPGAIGIVDSYSEALRFNEEKPYLEWVISRGWPNERRARRINFAGIARGVHTESFYSRLEGASDGIIDLRVMERDDEAKNLLRVRSLKGQPHDARWHEIEIKPTGEASLAT